MSPGHLVARPAVRSGMAVVASVAVAAAGVFLVDRSSATSRDRADASTPAAVAVPPARTGPREPGPPDRLPRAEQRGLDAADGVVPAGVTVFDDRYAAVANLDAALLGALRRAATAARRRGVTLYVDSGWRSARYQEQLLRRAIAKYGSEAEAARWVATPETSAHVSGDAVDIGHGDATAWLGEHGATYGLCQIYRNEPWHYELRAGAADHGCPVLYADAAHDPRMQR